MNAYELADELQDLHGFYCEDAANMLRQQADRIERKQELIREQTALLVKQNNRIAELEEQRSYLTKTWKLKEDRIAELEKQTFFIADSEKQGDPIAWMLADKENEYIRSIMAVQHDFVPQGCVEIPLYTSLVFCTAPQIKELSDEEISLVIWESYQSIGNATLTDLCKAILKKASEK